MSPKAAYGEETKAAAMAALLAGGRVRQVARDFGVPEGTVKSWRHRLKNGRVATLKKGAFGDLLARHLEALLRSLIEQSGHLSDPDVLRGMRAGEAGVYFGILFDRTMRMLELAPALLRDRGRGRHELSQEQAAASRGLRPRPFLLPQVRSPAAGPGAPRG